MTHDDRREPGRAANAHDGESDGHEGHQSHRGHQGHQARGHRDHGDEDPDDAHETDEPPLTPEESLRLIEQGRSEATRRLDGDPLLFYVPWGIAWLIGFGLLFLRFGPDERVFVPMAEWLPLTVLFVLMAVAMAVTAWAGYRAQRHVSGDSSVRGMYYGVSWFVGFMGVMTALGRVADHLPDPQRSLLYAGAAIALVGALYAAGSAVWRDSTMFVYGVWLSVINVVGITLGPGWHSLVVSLAGGGGLVLIGFIARVRMMRSQA